MAATRHPSRGQMKEEGPIAVTRTRHWAQVKRYSLDDPDLRVSLGPPPAAAAPPSAAPPGRHRHPLAVWTTGRLQAQT